MQEKGEIIPSQFASCGHFPVYPELASANRHTELDFGCCKVDY
jgi:hypothetical protein